METEAKQLCAICQKDKPLLKAVLRLLSFKGWEEETVLACRECIEFEGMKEVKEEKAA